MAVVLLERFSPQLGVKTLPARQMSGKDAPKNPSVVGVLQVEQLVDNDVVLQARSQFEDMFGKANPAM